MNSLRTFPVLLVLALCLFPAVANAQDDGYLPEKVQLVEEPQRWTGTLRIGTSGSLVANDSVVGQVDGNSTTISFSLDGGLDFKDGGHELRNTLSLDETFAETPNIDGFVKTADLLAIESIYYYKIKSLPWVGPFARLKFETSLFNGEDVRESPVEYVKPGESPAVDDVGNPQDGAVLKDRFLLTTPFSPTKIKESLGGFARPYETDPLRIEVRLGGGAQHFFGGDGFVLADDEETPQVELAALDDVHQAGAEMVLLAEGKAKDGKVTYGSSVEVLTPLYSSADSGRDPIEATNIEFTARASLKIVEWASLNYEYKAIRQPDVIAKVQTQHQLLLTIGYTLIDTKKKEEAKAEEAKPEESKPAEPAKTDDKAAEVPAKADEAPAKADDTKEAPAKTEEKPADADEDTDGEN